MANHEWAVLPCSYEPGVDEIPHKREWIALSERTGQRACCELGAERIPIPLRSERTDHELGLYVYKHGRTKYEDITVRPVQDTMVLIVQMFPQCAGAKINLVTGSGYLVFSKLVAQTDDLRALQQRNVAENAFMEEN